MELGVLKFECTFDNEFERIDDIGLLILLDGVFVLEQ
jgi:hypothetical protein